MFLATGFTDLRRGIDDLASIVQQQFELDPFSNTLFLFCGRRRDRIKALYWEGDGFVLLYKRLESGSFQWPRSETEVKALTPQQYRWLMDGVSIDQPKAHKAVNTLEIVMGIFLNAAALSEIVSVISGSPETLRQKRFVTLTLAVGFLLGVITECVRNNNMTALILFALGFMLSYAAFILTVPEKRKLSEKR